jgi:hypothetical protein
MAAKGDETSTNERAVSRHRQEIEWDRREPVSFTVQSLLSTVEDCEPIDLDPLAEYVDPDALEAFFGAETADPTPRSLTFEYDDHTVHVDGERVLVE